MLEKTSVKDFRKRAPERNRIFTREQQLSETIWKYFAKRLAFPRIMKMIKDKGFQGVYEAWNEVKQSGSKDPLALFIWKVGKQKIVLLPVDKDTK